VLEKTRKHIVCRSQLRRSRFKLHKFKIIKIILNMLVWAVQSRSLFGLLNWDRQTPTSWSCNCKKDYWRSDRKQEHDIVLYKW